jgi:iron complex outermembrane receptor protein
MVTILGDEYVSATPVAKEVSFPIAKVSKEEQSADVFKHIQENEINRKVEVASLFKEDDLVAGSTVGVVDEKQWRKYGARRTSEAVQYMPGTFVPGYTGGVLPIVIRGYTTTQSLSGVATLIDGVPVNTFTNSSAMLSIPNFGLGTLNRIEMIRGPGSAIYGSDAFHYIDGLQV